MSPLLVQAFVVLVPVFTAALVAVIRTVQRR